MSSRIKVRPWSDLPDLLLYFIMSRLTSFDLMAFGGVCTAWRSVFSTAKRDLLEKQPPFLLSQMRNPVCMELRALSDLSRHQMGQLPPSLRPHTLLGVSHGRLVLAADEGKRSIWAVKSNRNLRVVDLGSHTCFFLPQPPIRFHRAVLLPPSPEAPDGLLLCLSFEKTGSLYFCVLRAGRMKWTKQRWEGMDLYRLFPSNNCRKVFAMPWSYETKIAVMDLVLRPKPALVETDRLPDKPPGTSRGFETVYLAEVDGQLLLFDAQSSCCSAYSLDPSTREWVAVSTLGGRSLFLSRNQCLVRDGTSAWGCETDCIYFLDSTGELKKFRVHDGQVELLRHGRQSHQFVDDSDWVSPLSYYL